MPLRKQGHFFTNNSETERKLKFDIFVKFCHFWQNHSIFTTESDLFRDRFPVNSSQFYSKEDPSILTRSVESLLRKLIKFFIGRISLVKLQEIVRYIFVEEIENSLKRDHPTKNISLSQIALLSGLDTRTLSRIRNSPSYRKPFHTKSQFLKESVPGASIIDYWKSSAKYVDRKSGEPRKISVSGPEPSFEALFQVSTKSRGVTYTSLLTRLEENGTVKICEDTRSVELVSDSYLPAVSDDINGAIEVGFSAITNLTETVTHNINSLYEGGERLYQRGAWTYRLDPNSKNEFRTELRTLLEETDQQARKVISKYEEPFESTSEITAGVSFFYFEET